MKKLLIAGATIALACLFLCSPVEAAAAPDWLRAAMHDEAKTWQPKQPAIFLLQEVKFEFLSPDRVLRTTRGAIHSRTDEGLASLKTQLVYDSENQRIDSVKAWLVSPKGKVVELTRRDFVDRSASTDSRLWNNRRVLIANYATRAEVGSILAWEHRIELPLVRGTFKVGLEQSLPLFAGKLSGVVPNGYKLIGHSLHPEIQKALEKSNETRFESSFSRLPRLPSRAPPQFAPIFCDINVRCVPASATDTSVSAEWAAFAQAWTPLFYERAVVDPSIHEAARAATQGRKNRWERLQALSEFVQKKVAYLAVTEESDIFAGFRPNLAPTVLASGLGDCKDKVTLLMALAKAIDEPAVPILVNSTNALDVDPQWPGLSFNHVFVGFPADSNTPPHWFTLSAPDGRRFVLFDPTHRTLTFGSMPTGDVERHVLVLGEQNGFIARVGDQCGGNPSVSTRLELWLQERKATASYQLTHYGARAHELRRMMDNQTATGDLKILENLARERLGSCESVQGEFKWESAQLAARMELRCTIPSPLRLAGGRDFLFVPPFADFSEALPSWKTTFPGSVNLPPLVQEDTVTLHLPAGATTKDLPAPSMLKDCGVECSISYEVSGNALVCRQTVVRPARTYSKSEYEAMRQLFERAAQIGKVPLLLELAQNAAEPPISR